MDNRPTVLLIEDSPTQSKEIAAYMSMYDVDVMIAEDGPQGLRLALMNPSLIILDVNLPSMNGFQVCRRLKRDPETASIPIIMLTSSDRSEDMLQGLEAGADDYIAKDEFAVDSLLVALQSMGVLTPRSHYGG